jgi:uncharacterized membrane protein YkoI
MRALLVVLGLFAICIGARAQDSGHAPECLPAREVYQALVEHRLIAPEAAVIAARHATPGGDVLRASLCHSPEGLVYVIMALRKDGRVVQVTIDAPSGKVKSVR